MSLWTTTGWTNVRNVCSPPDFSLQDPGELSGVPARTTSGDGAADKVLSETEEEFWQDVIEVTETSAVSVQRLRGTVTVCCCCCQ